MPESEQKAGFEAHTKELEALQQELRAGPLEEVESRLPFEKDLEAKVAELTATAESAAATNATLLTTTAKLKADIADKVRCGLWVGWKSDGNRKKASCISLHHSTPYACSGHSNGLVGWLARRRLMCVSVRVSG